MKEKFKKVGLLAVGGLLFCAGILSGLILGEKIKGSEDCISVTYIEPSGYSSDSLYFIRELKKEDGIVKFQIRQNAFIMDGLPLELSLNSDTLEVTAIASHLPLKDKTTWSGNSLTTTEDNLHIDCLLQLSDSTETPTSAEYIRIKGRFSDTGMGELKWKLLSLYASITNQS